MPSPDPLVPPPIVMATPVLAATPVPGGRRPQAWHWLLVWPSLLVLTLGVAFPVWLGAVAISTVLAGLWAEAHLDRVSIGGGGIALALLCAAVALFIAGVGELRARPPALPAQGSRARAWLKRHPWWTLGLVLGAACAVVVPSFHERTSLPFLVTVVVFTTSGWFSCTASWACYRFARAVVMGSWRGALASNALAALLVAGATAVGMGWLGLSAVAVAHAEELADQSRARLGLPAPQPQAEGGGGLSLLGSGGSDFSACMESAGEALQQSAAREATQFVSPDDARDVVREVLLNLCAKGIIPGLKQGYFYKSVRNLAIDWYRKQRRSCSLDSVPEPACDTGDDSTGLPSDAERTLQRAWCTLGEADQELLRLRYELGLRHEAIAARLGTNTDAARQRVHRAEARLKKAYLDICG